MNIQSDTTNSMQVSFNRLIIKKGSFDVLKQSENFPKDKNHPRYSDSMLDFYSKQWFPSSHEMFVCSPAEFKHLISQVVRYNDSIIDAFGGESGAACDPLFVKLFKYQVKVPFAMSYFSQVFTPAPAPRAPEGAELMLLGRRRGRRAGGHSAGGGLPRTVRQHRDSDRGGPDHGPAGALIPWRGTWSTAWTAPGRAPSPTS